MPIGSGCTTQALAAMHGGGEPEVVEPHRRLLQQRMEPLSSFRPPADSDVDRDDRRLTRLLVNVTVDRSLWPVHLVLGADATVADLVRAAVAAYAREGRRPPLAGAAADGFELHLDKYSLQSLRLEDKVLDLGSRNFFLCARRPAGLGLTT